MGGTLALRLAAEPPDDVSGLVLVNPGNKMHGAAARTLPVTRHLIRTAKGIASDIAKPGTPEIGYGRVPLHAAHSLRRLFQVVDAQLPRVTQPLLLLHSPEDHVVPPVDSARILGRVSSRDVTERLLERSYHVATLDYDAQFVFEETYAFIGRLAPSVAEGAGKEGTAASG